MSRTQAPNPPQEAPPETMVRPTTVPRGRRKTKRQPPYAVVLHNDDINGMDHVVGVLRKVFNYGATKALWLMLQAHVSGQCVIWTGSLEVAELKADQVRSCGPDPNMRDRGACPLQVSIEPVPA